MGKKSYQSGDRYAKQGSQPKKRRSQKPRPQVNATAAPAEPDATQTVTQQVSQPAPRAPRRAQAAATAATYDYVFADLKKTGIFAAAAFVILIVLAIII